MGSEWAQAGKAPDEIGISGRWFGCTSVDGLVDFTQRASISPNLDLAATQPACFIYAGFLNLGALVSTPRRQVHKDSASEHHTLLLHRLVDEIHDELGNRVSWFSLYRHTEASVEMRLGSIWDIFVVHVGNAAYAIHCSWDS